MYLADLFEAAEVLELYDFMACIIRSFLDRTDISIDALYAEAAEDEKDIYWDWQLNGNEDSLLDIDIHEKPDIELLDALQRADQLACKARGVSVGGRRACPGTPVHGWSEQRGEQEKDEHPSFAPLSMYLGGRKQRRTSSY